MKNLIVQLHGIGNLIQMEPLLRVLGEGDVLCDPARSVHELAPLFPKWNFLRLDQTTGKPQGTTHEPYDDIYLGFPIAGMRFSSWGNRLHYPVWSFGKWDRPLYHRYTEMAAHRWEGEDGFDYNAFSFSSVKEYGYPHLSIPDASKLEMTIAVSLGYWRGDGGAWVRKNWGEANLQQALDALAVHGYKGFLTGKREDYPKLLREGDFGRLLDQIGAVAGCSGYLGNDTGFAHIAGALGLPSAVYTVEDKVKVRTAAPKLLQFGPETSPEEAVDWLIRAIEEESYDGTKETLQAQARADSR